MKFVIREKFGQRFFFSLEGKSDEIFFVSRDFGLRQECMDMIGWIKRSSFEKIHDVKISSDDKYSFCIKDDKGGVVGSSRDFSSPTELNRKIERIEQGIKAAEIVGLASD